MIAEEGLVERAAALLHAKPPLWNSLTGTVSICSNEELLDLGRARFHGEADDAHDVRSGCTGAITERRHRFWAISRPWQLRIERARASRPGSRRPRESVLIVNRFRWWSRTARGVTSGDCTPDRVTYSRDGPSWATYGDIVLPAAGLGNLSPGTEDLDILLRPAALTRAFAFSRAETAAVADRPAIVLTALPRSEDDFLLNGKGLVALGTDWYTLSVDADCGILLESVANIDGRLARRHALSDPSVDEALDPTLFTAPGWDPWPEGVKPGPAQRP